MDGELPERLRRSVEAHLADCEVCRERLEEIQGVNELFQGSLPVPPVPDGLARRIMDEARRRNLASTPKRRFQPLAWNPVQWIVELSASMRLAAGVTVLLALIAGLSLDGRGMTGPDVSIEPGKDLAGLEWFAPTPPGSIGSIYIAMADQRHERGNGQ